MARALLWRRVMHHHVAHAVEGEVLFTTWEEAALLWRSIVRSLPGLLHLCLMNNHLHLLHADDVRIQLGHVLSGYTRARNARTGRSGALVRPMPPPTVPASRAKRLTDTRYVLVNPCAARIVADPLAWPFSTHRDTCGFAVPAVRRRAEDPWRWHRWVCEHPSVVGADLPLRAGAASLEDVRAAVSEVARIPMSALDRKGAGRALFLAAARALAAEPPREIADRLGVSRSAVHQARADARTLAVIERVLGDRRFPGLVDGDPRLLRPRSQVERNWVPWEP